LRKRRSAFVACPQFLLVERARCFREALILFVRTERGGVLRRRTVASPAGPAALALRRLRHDRAALAYGSLFLVLLLAFLAAPLYASQVAGTGPEDNHLSDVIVVDGERTFVVSEDGVPIGPTWQAKFFLGADENGRDLMVRLLYGGRTSVLIGGCAVALTVLLATPLALVAGFFGGRIDSLVSRMLDLIWSFPVLLVGVLLSTVLSLSGARIGPVTIEAGAKVIPITVIGIVYVPYIARPLRGQVMALRGQPFVEAARSSGQGPARIMSSELLPHLWTTVLVLTPLLFANAVVLESALSFLGAGVPAPEPSFGVLIDEGLGDVVLSPHLLLAPAITLVLVVLSLSGLADAARRAFDPHGKLGVDLVHGQ
jgi:peptide/nickel transport system permease protein